MSVSEAIITWLGGFTYNSQGLQKVNTDRQDETAKTYALIKEPIVNIKAYLSGRKEHTEHYEISARLSTQTETNRKSNSEWLEQLEKWIASQNAFGSFPTIDNATVNEIKVTSAYYLGTTNENTSVYSITISIRYTE